VAGQGGGSSSSSSGGGDVDGFRGEGEAGAETGDDCD